ncbi:type II toxin-antitoxin system VapC family toxin [uncultured Sphingomonas sp.]|uniref:type II toxin-antitoxin system VapC family toxin n=1 Tax=uncultured Sphingomonas sp. TaxID=158754 RepID=UPI0035CB53D1
MIVLDGSALFAIMLGEPDAERCQKAIERADELLLSAASLTEILVVATRKGILARARSFVERLDPKVVPLTHDRALAAGAAFERWGHRQDRAGLNYGDSFAYALAKEFDCPLLFIGNDFSLTDIRPALEPRD